AVPSVGNRKATQALLKNLEFEVRGEKFKLNATGLATAPGLKTITINPKDSLKFNVSLSGLHIDTVSFDQSLRSQQNRVLSAFDLRQLGQTGDLRLLKKTSDAAAELPASRVDLHTHFGGAILTETILEVA